MKTYQELSAEAKLSGDTTEVEKFEARVAKAESYYLNKEACAQDTECVWYCYYRGASATTRTNKDAYPKDIDSLVRRWRREHRSCGAVSRDDLNRLLRSIYY